MRILVDTNVLVSAVVFDGSPEKLLKTLVEKNYRVFITTYIEKEFFDIIDLKWKDKADVLRGVFYKMDFSVLKSTDEVLGNLRDPKDIAVLSDALYYHADVILTGDKDFLESGYKTPKMLSVSDMWKIMNE